MGAHQVNRSRIASVFAALATALLMIVAAHPARAQGARNATGAVRTEAALETQQAGDTARFRARWAFACDAGGCPDSVLITWALNGVGRPTKASRATRDTAWTLRTICPGATTASATIVAMRRGRASAQLVRSATMGCRDVNPPPVDSFAIDTGFVFRTALHVDSFPVVHVSAAADYYRVLRADSLRVGVRVVYVNNNTPQAQLLGAFVLADACRGLLWPATDTTSVKIAQARAAQWPARALTTKARNGLLAYDAKGCG